MEVEVMANQQLQILGWLKMVVVEVTEETVVHFDDYFQEQLVEPFERKRPESKNKR